MLQEALYSRRRKRTWCAFIDIKKAYDVAWYDTALVRLQRLGVHPALWHLIDDIRFDCSSCVRLSDGLSNVWDTEGGLAQGRVLSPLLFNIFINDFLTEMHFRPRHL